MYIGLHVKYLLLLSDLTKFEFPQQSTEVHSNIKFPKNRLLRAELFHADGQTRR